MLREFGINTQIREEAHLSLGRKCGKTVPRWDLSALKSGCFSMDSRFLLEVSSSNPHLTVSRNTKCHKWKSKKRECKKGASCSPSVQGWPGLEVPSFSSLSIPTSVLLLISSWEALRIVGACVYLLT